MLEWTQCGAIRSRANKYELQTQTHLKDVPLSLGWGLPRSKWKSTTCCTQFSRTQTIFSFSSSICCPTDDPTYTRLTLTQQATEYSTPHTQANAAATHAPLISRTAVHGSYLSSRNSHSIVPAVIKMLCSWITLGCNCKFWMLEAGCTSRTGDYLA